MQRILSTVNLAVPLALATVLAASAAPAAAQDLLGRAVTPLNHHADLTTEITAANVKQLQPAWEFQADDFVSHSPQLHEGFLYFADWGGTVYKLTADDGSLVWKNKVEQPMTKWPWHGFCGDGAIGGGMLFEASAEGTIFALDLETGDVRWKKEFVEDPQAGNCGELFYWDGMVYIPVASVEEMLTAKLKDFEPDFHGRVIALNAETGERVWELLLSEPPHNGAGVWSGFAYDPGSGALFFTTSNNYTGESNEFSDAFVAVNARSGEILWKTQVTQHDVWVKAKQEGPDYAFGAAPQLFEAEYDGREMKLVGAGQKSGIYYALDRETGELVWTNVVGYGDIGGGIHADASIGADRVLVWSNNSYQYGKPAEKFPLSIKALDLATGKNLWVLNHAQPAAIPSAGFLSNDVYFVGSLDGQVRAYHAASGKQLWTSPKGGGAVSTDLIVDADMLFFGTGLPKNFGGDKGGNAIRAFQVSRER